VVEVYDNRDYLRSHAQGNTDTTSNTKITRANTLKKDQMDAMMTESAFSFSSGNKSGPFSTSPFVRMSFWSGYISSLCFVDDDRHLLVSSGDGTFSICDYIANKCISRLQVDGDILTCDYVFIRPFIRKRAQARINQLSKMSMELDHFLENDPVINGIQNTESILPGDNPNVFVSDPSQTHSLDSLTLSADNATATKKKKQKKKKEKKY